LYELALFAGAGGGIYGGILCNHTCIGAVEIEEFPREVLKQRQRDGILPEFPIWDDVTTFRSDNPECSEFFRLLRSIKDELIISGGFPCQDISSAGKGAGIEEGTRSGLWFEYARIIREIQPAGVFVENSPVITSRGLGVVLGDWAEMGYKAKWGVLGAVDAGAPHKRERMWIYAFPDSDSSGCQWQDLSYTAGWHEVSELIGTGDVADSDSHPVRIKQESDQRSEEATQPDLIGTEGNAANSDQLNGDRSRYDTGNVRRQRPTEANVSGSQGYDAPNAGRKHGSTGDTERMEENPEKRTSGFVHDQSGSARPRGAWWAESGVDSVADGVADRKHRLKALGNGQVPGVVKLAWEILKNEN